MTGVFQFADLTFQYDDDFKNLIRVQKVEREVHRAIDDLSEAAGIPPPDVEIILDEVDPDDGNSFEQPRLRAIVPEESRIYTIDISQSDQPNNPLGFYVAYDKAIDVYDWETEQQTQIARGEDRRDTSKSSSTEQQRTSSQPDQGDDEYREETKNKQKQPGTSRDGQLKAIRNLAGDTSDEKVLRAMMNRGVITRGIEKLDDLSFHEAAQVIQEMQS